jgi:hypothetical protein
VSAGPAGPTPARVPQTQDAIPVPKLPENCTVTLQKTEAAVTEAGGAVIFAPKFLPAQCATEPVSTAGWLKRVKSANSAVYSFVAEANGTRLARQAAIRVGDVSMIVSQAPGKVRAFAAAPSRVEFTFSGKSVAKQTVFAWSDDSGGAFAARTPTAWLRVTPAGKAGKAGAQKFTVELAPAELKPGLHQGVIEINSPGTVNDPIQIRVVVTVADKRR